MWVEGRGKTVEEMRNLTGQCDVVWEVFILPILSFHVNYGLTLNDRSDD